MQMTPHDVHMHAPVTRSRSSTVGLPQIIDVMRSWEIERSTHRGLDRIAGDEARHALLG
jgi:hypothetical protein